MKKLFLPLCSLILWSACQHANHSSLSHEEKDPLTVKSTAEDSALHEETEAPRTFAGTLSSEKTGKNLKTEDASESVLSVPEVVVSNPESATAPPDHAIIPDKYSIEEMKATPVSADEPALIPAGVTLSEVAISDFAPVSMIKTCSAISVTTSEGLTMSGARHETRSAVPVGAAAASGAAVNPALAGKLTAGEINDFAKWKMWDDIADGELKAYQKIWQVAPEKRYSVILSNNHGFPVCDAQVELIGRAGQVIWASRTDQTGRAELWEDFVFNTRDSRAAKIVITHKGMRETIEDPIRFGEGVNTASIDVPCGAPDYFDLTFTVDATGSMQDEIDYLQAELVDVITRIKETHKEIQVRTASVFYRDQGDTYLTQHAAFTENLNESIQFISEQYADGGGDGPEAVDDALETALYKLNWSKEAVARINFLILDAPPHEEENNLVRIHNAIREYSKRGIRIIPLVASGGGYDLDKSLEYLMRCCALGTNATYAFLTNHSGIGNPHTAPSTDHYEVESLNALLIRLMNQYLDYPSCDLEDFLESALLQTEITEGADSILVPDLYAVNKDSVPDPILQNHDLAIRCYPNPADDYTWLELPLSAKEIFLLDSNGKLIYRWTSSELKQHIDLSSLPSGIYHFRAWIDEKWLTTRVIVAKK